MPQWIDHCNQEAPHSALGMPAQNESMRTGKSKTRHDLSTIKWGSTVWRFWQEVANYVVLLQRVVPLLPEIVPRRLFRSEWNRPEIVFEELWRLRKQYLLVPRHGATGNAFTELWTFVRRYWMKYFLRHDFVVILTEAMRLFYTGHMVFGKHWGLRSREWAAKMPGSATIIYVVRSVEEEALPAPRVCRGD